MSAKPHEPCTLCAVKTQARCRRCGVAVCPACSAKGRVQNRLVRQCFACNRKNPLREIEMVA